jgi:hypothetical protein
MITPEYLNGGELHCLTGYARSGDQSEWLTKHSIPFLKDGKRIVVSREHVRARIEGRIVVSSKGLNLSGIK